MAEHMIPRFFRRFAFFASIAWRPGTGPSRDEPPMNALQVWWHYRISIATAWQLACLFHPTPAQQAENLRKIRVTLDEMRAAKEATT